MHRLPNLAAPSLWAFCLYKEKDNFPMNYYPNHNNVEINKLHNIDNYAPSKAIYLQSLMWDSLCK